MEEQCRSDAHGGFPTFVDVHQLGRARVLWRLSDIHHQGIHSRRVGPVRSTPLPQTVHPGFWELCSLACVASAAVRLPAR